MKCSDWEISYNIKKVEISHIRSIWQKCGSQTAVAIQTAIRVISMKCSDWEISINLYQIITYKTKKMKVACNFDNTNSILSSVVQILPPPSGTPSINRGRVILHRLGCGPSPQSLRDSSPPKVWRSFFKGKGESWMGISWCCLEYKKRPTKKVLLLLCSPSNAHLRLVN